ncbi:hypothetical protein [Pseudonocardia abyssalis]|uniref:VOC domain-containing protein n=1 Tax=Pseudonocardia abyssalis TaxID=2792008 RepID=A0ABS6UQQ5_9PSEU|nr:hypothetical protein [Pseudonocardia abyssalis]MBW0115725.1 hypothetical protein [Pseudonocardia abyssalis]MBW0134590.1 hypothetical protein [Pseudonocardia abyssalis]
MLLDGVHHIAWISTDEARLVGLGAATPAAFETIRRRLVEAGASDGQVNDFGGALSMFFRDPDGLEGEVLLPEPAS